jgi:hypothetical protein
MTFSRQASAHHCKTQLTYKQDLRSKYLATSYVLAPTNENGYYWQACETKIVNDGVYSFFTCIFLQVPCFEQNG